MTPVPHRTYEELVAGYALSALEPEDEQLLRHHLPVCSLCERDLTVHRETLAHLAYAGDPAEPPPSLWEGIRSQALSAGAPASLPGAGQPAPSDDAPVAPAGVGDLAAARAARHRRPSGRPAAWLAAAAAFALVVGLGAWNASLQRDRGELRDALATATRTSAPAAPAQAVPITARGGDVAAVAVLQDGRLSLVVDDLPPNDRSDSIYVLWGRSAGAVHALAAFDVAGQPEALHDVPLPPAAGAPDLLMITREPGRAAPAATQQPLLATGTVT